MTDQLFQVARTYAYRPRFWIFGGCYVLSMLWWTAHAVAPVIRSITSVALAAMVGCFVALHLRRQFGSSGAKMMPGFAGPHLAVGALVSLSIWLVVPAVGAWLVGLPLVGRLGIHAIAGIFLALVVCWRRVILLLAATPLLVMWMRTTILTDHSWAERFVEGQFPWIAASLFAIALVLHVAAAVVLLRLSDQSAAVSDDFLVETPRTDHIVGRWDDWLLTFRDTAVRHRLADAGSGWWTVERWRIPTVGSWLQLGLAVSLAMLLLGIIWGASGERPMAGVVAVLIAAPIMLVAPFGSWHQRRIALGLESMRPVTRTQFVREIFLALALDVFRWTCVASIFSTATLYLTLFFAWHTAPPSRANPLPILAGQFMIIWS
ncbi:MAG TPA: hypothetical protein VHV08_08810, partial [Pirellulales bacterium]|nr:hypothetical protein [Pirellulales bacterium]